MINNIKCNLCNSLRIQEKISFGSHPATHLLCTKDGQYVNNNYKVRLGICEHCGLVQLLDSPIINETYDDYYPSSWKTQAHISNEIRVIMNILKTSHDAKILEIGSNDGNFLRELRTEGFRNLLGIEPAQGPREIALKEEIETFPQFMSPDFAEQLIKEKGVFDLIIIRQVAEHIPDLEALAISLNILMRDGAHILIEVPDFDSMLASLDYTAIWEQHLNYFTNDSLCRFLTSAGIRPIKTENYNFSGGCLVIYGEKTCEPQSVPPISNIPASVNLFFDTWETFKEEFKALLEQYKGSVIVYGVGCRSIPLLRYANLLHLVNYYVDDNSEKQKKVIPGTNLIVQSSESLKTIDPGLILLGVNAENEDKVFTKNHEIFTRHKATYSLNPPSSKLPPFWLKLVSLFCND
jgi:hypothetical protein